MPQLDLNVNWADFLSAATDLVLMACLAMFAVACALILVYAAMLASEMRQRHVPSPSELLGFGHAAPRRRVALSPDTPVRRIMRPSMVWVQGLLQRL